METTLLIALIGALGIGSQWLAWRLKLPAIVLMLAAGIFAGPVTGWVNPEADFGDLFRPMVAVAVALILFEGGITLKFKMLRDAGPAVKRLVLFGAPLGWLFSTLAARYGAGLGWGGLGYIRRHPDRHRPHSGYATIAPSQPIQTPR